MSIALIVLSLSLLLLAGAIELWWGMPARRARALSLDRIADQLDQRHATEAAKPALPNTPRTQAGTPTDGKPVRKEWPWDGYFRGAGFAAGWKLPAILLLCGFALSWFSAVRIGSAWMAPLTFALFALAVWFWLSRRIEKRQQRILSQLPDFLENMVRLTALGKSLPMAFQGATGQVPQPLRTLLDDTLRNARGGMDLDRALSVAARPYRLQVLEVLALVLGMCLRVGGRADHILQRMSDFMRDLAQAQQELRATTSETRASAWVLGLLPPVSALFMALMSPDFFQPLLHEPFGHKLLLVAIVMEAIGVLLLYKLAKSL